MAGDADCNGEIEIDDALDTLLGVAIDEQAACSQLADTNCDTSVTAADVQPLLAYAAGLPPAPSSGCPPVGSGGDVEFLSYQSLGEDENGDIWVLGDHAYVGTYCGSHGAKVIDVSDPANPRVTRYVADHLNTSAEDVMAIPIVTPQFAGDILAVGLQDCAPPEAQPGLAGVEFWDVTNPDQPAMLSFHQVGLARGVHELFLTARGDRAYALLAVPYAEVWDGRGDVRIVDITDPRNPVEVADWGIGKDLGRAFGSVTLSQFGPPYDCTPPAGTPAYCRGSLPFVYAHSVSADETGQTAYVSYWDAGMVTLDISDPTNPSVLSHSDVPLSEEGDLHSAVKVPGRNLVVTTDEDLSPNFAFPSHEGPGVGPGLEGWGFARIWDTTNPGAPVELARITTPNSQSSRADGWYSVHNPFTTGDRTYFSWYSDGVRVFDTADPGHVHEIAYYVPPRAFVWGMYVSGDIVFASDINSGLWIFRVPEQ